MRDISRDVIDDFGIGKEIDFLEFFMANSLHTALRGSFAGIARNIPSGALAPLALGNQTPKE